MRTTTIANNGKYEVRLFEFITPTGWTITSFSQLIKIPDIVLGCFDTYDEALLWLQHPQQLEERFIEKPYDFFLGEKVLISADELATGILKWVDYLYCLFQPVQVLIKFCHCVSFLLSITLLLSLFGPIRSSRIIFAFIKSSRTSPSDIVDLFKLL